PEPARDAAGDGIMEEGPRGPQPAMTRFALVEYLFIHDDGDEFAIDDVSEVTLIANAEDAEGG
ncbi:MAG: hypothetical protein ACRDH5_00525, partial [bacterium]